jgi:DNA-directed RNA polymerase
MHKPEDVGAIARQLTIEAEALTKGQQMLQDRTTRAEERKYASSTIYGKKALSAALPGVSELIRKRIGEITMGRAGQSYAALAKTVKDMDPEVIAVLTLKSVLDVLGTIDFKDDVFRYSRVCDRIGQAIQTEARLSHYKEENPDLYGRVEHFFHKGAGTRQKETVMKLRFRREGFEWDTWSRSMVFEVGAWAFRMAAEATGWFTTTKVKTGKARLAHVVVLTSEFLGLRDAVMQRAMELASCSWPMVCKPVRWTEDPHHRGGYLTAEAHGHSLVRRGCYAMQGSLPVETINRLQEVAYRINPVILATAQEFKKLRRSIGDFHQESAREVPNWLGDDPSEEDKLRYKRARREAEDFNSRLGQHNWRTTEALSTAERFAVEERFYIPWNFDYRGRMYPLTTTITPQGTDFDKSLLLFADPGPINEWWLAFQVATTYGLDKATLEDRVTWTRDNLDLISLVAEDPTGSLNLWESAEEPWSFLAACVEYHQCCIACTKTASDLPIGVDATCSGLQHLSALTGDPSTAAEVNVLPTPKPADAYRTVAQKSTPFVPAQYREHMDRKITKRTVMTLPYGLERHSARGYIRSAFKDKGILCDQDLTEITKAIYDTGMPETFPGPIRVMKWLKETARSVIADAEQIRWTTPSGFVVTQDQRKPTFKIVNTKIMGVGRMQNRCYQGPGAVDKDGHAKALPPNLIHSLDASLLHFMFSEWDRPFTCIHDCILGRSCDMDDMQRDIRLHFVEMYKGMPLQDFADQLGVEVPPGIYIGNLDLDQTNDSLYFFC